MSRSSATLLGIFLGLGALVLVVFGQTSAFQFVNYDDGSYVYQNSHITSGLTGRNIAWAFTHVHSTNWHPLTSLSHMLDCQLFGVRSEGPHAVNVFLHLATTLLLFQFFRLSTGQLWCSAVAAALFAVHPLRAESVAWISERKDVLSGLFFVLTLLSYLRYSRRPAASRRTLVLATLAAGLMSKPMLVSVPVVLLVLDFWPLARKEKITRLLLEKVPLVLLSFGSAAATLLAQRLALGTSDNLPLVWRLNNAALSYVNYLRQIFWPVDLVPFYLHPEGKTSLLTSLSAIVLLLIITIAAFGWRKRAPWLPVGWLWYLVMLVPVIGVVQVGLQARADRYTYLPQIGIIIAVTWSVRYLVKSRIFAGALAIASIALSTALAFRQTTHWRDTETLWSYTLIKSPENDVALTGLAGIQLVRGETERATANYQRAVELRPGNAAAQHGLALALWRERKVDAAIAHWERSLSDQPDNNEARDYLGTALASVGRDEEAAGQWRTALNYDRDDGNAANNLAWLLATSQTTGLRDPPEAVRLADHAKTLPGGDNAVVYRTLAAALAANGEFTRAMTAVEHAADLAHRAQNEAQASEMEKWRNLFRSGKTFRDH